MIDDNRLVELLAGFTQNGTPLPAMTGNKMEWGVTILTAATELPEHFILLINFS